MLSFLGGALGAGVSGLFGLASNEQNYNNAKSLMQAQMSLNREQAEWQALNMPSLQMKGLRDAGLNPLLAFSGMSANSAQGVSLGTAENSNIGQAMVEGARAGADAVKNSSAEQLMEQQVEVAKQQEDTLQSQEKLNNANALKTITDSINSGKRLNADLDYVREQIRSLKFDNKIKKDRTDWYDDIWKPIKNEIRGAVGYVKDNIYTPLKNGISGLFK